MPYPGEILAGTYQIVDEIGKGGAGIIYRAYHLNLQKYVVVKKIKDHFVGVLNARGEVDILKSLHHTYLPQVYDFIQMGNEVFTVMDYVDGHDFQYYIDAQYVFEEQQVWRWLTQALEVLDYLHRHGILHLDIKPANIMLTPEWNICLIDFNISLDSDGEGMTGISQVYASPEQYQKWYGILYRTAAKDIILDGRSDIYSLGGTFYQLMTGYPPSPDPAGMYPLPSVQKTEYSSALAGIISRMLQADRKRRYASAGKVLSAVRRVNRSRREKGTLRAVFVLMLSAVAVLCAAAGIVAYRGHSRVSPAQRQEIAEEESALAQKNAAGEYAEAYQEGTRFLNVNADTLKKISGARQSIVEQVLQSCLGLEDYESALACVEELLQYGDDPEYMQEAAVVYAYRGDFETAQSYIQAAVDAGGDTRGLKQSRAEIYAAQGDYGRAVDAYRELYAESPEIDVLRRIAALCLRAGTDASLSAADADQYLSQAIDSYEQLYQGDQAVYADRMNLAVAYMRAGMDEKAVSLLQSMSVDYPGRYQVFLNLAVLEYNAELKKAPASRDFSQVKEYADQARQCYESGGYEGEDGQLQELLHIVDDLP